MAPPKNALYYNAAEFLLSGRATNSKMALVMTEMIDPTKITKFHMDSVNRVARNLYENQTKDTLDAVPWKVYRKAINKVDAAPHLWQQQLWLIVSLIKNNVIEHNHADLSAKGRMIHQEDQLVQRDPEEA